MARKMKSVSMSQLKATLEATLSSSVEEAVVATVTMAPGPAVEAAPVEVEAPELPAFTQAPNPPIAGVKRNFTPEERVAAEASWKKVQVILEAAVAELTKEGRAILKEEERLADEQLRRTDIEIRLSEALKKSAEEYQLVLTELMSENDDIKGEISKMDIKVRHEASYEPVQAYWTPLFEAHQKVKAKNEAEQAQRDAQFKEDCAAREAAARARKLRQNVNCAERAEANRQRANGSSNKGNGKDNGNGKKGGKGK